MSATNEPRPYGDLTILLDTMPVEVVAPDRHPDNWWRTGHALKNEGYPFETFYEWSLRDPRCSRDNWCTRALCKNQWNSADKSCTGKTIKAIYKECIGDLPSDYLESERAAWDAEGGSRRSDNYTYDYNDTVTYSSGGHAFGIDDAVTIPAGALAPATTGTRESSAPSKAEAPAGPVEFEVTDRVRELAAMCGGAPDNPAQDCMHQLAALFQAGDVVCFAVAKGSARHDPKRDKWTPGGAVEFRKVEDVITAMAGGGTIEDVFGQLEPRAGGWFCINPTDGERRATDHVTRFSHVLVECDEIPLEQQLAAYIALRLPMDAVWYSGGKSVHAAVRVDAKDKAEFRDRVRELYGWLSSRGLELDEQNKDASRLCRLAGLERGGRWQRLIWARGSDGEPFEGCCSSWDEWDAWRKSLDAAAMSATSTRDDEPAAVDTSEADGFEYRITFKDPSIDEAAAAPADVFTAYRRPRGDASAPWVRAGAGPEGRGMLYKEVERGKLVSDGMTDETAAWEPDTAALESWKAANGYAVRDTTTSTRRDDAARLVDAAPSERYEKVAGTPAAIIARAERVVTGATAKEGEVQEGAIGDRYAKIIWHGEEGRRKPYRVIGTYSSVELMEEGEPDGHVLYDEDGNSWTDDYELIQHATVDPDLGCIPNAWDIAGFAEGARGMTDKDLLEQGRRVVWNDQEVSRLFSEAYGKELRFNRDCGSDGRWMHYDGTCWGVDDGKPEELMKKFVDDLKAGTAKLRGRAATEARKGVETYSSYTAARHVIKYSECELAVGDDELDADGMLVNVQNGTIDLASGRVRQHESDDLITKTMACDYDPDADTTEVEKFVRRVCARPEDGGRDPELERFLQVLTARALSGGNPSQPMVILMGPNHTGKSTYLRILNRVFGDYGIAMSENTLTRSPARDGGAPSPHLARMKGRRLATDSEFHDKAPLDTALVKKLTGGDLVAARPMYARDAVEFVYCGAIWLATNYLPKTDDQTLFKGGRVVCVPFENHIDDDAIDNGMVDKLTTPEMRSAWLKWMLEGWKLDQSVKIPTPERCSAMLEEYQDDSDIIGQFIDERCVTGTECWCTGATLYELWVPWCDECGRKPGSRSDFYAKLKQHDGITYASRTWENTGSGERQLRSVFRGIQPTDEAARSLR